MAAVLNAEAGGGGVHIAIAMGRLLQRTSVPKQRHPVGDGPFGSRLRCPTGRVAMAMHPVGRLAGIPNGLRRCTEIFWWLV